MRIAIRCLLVLLTVTALAAPAGAADPGLQIVVDGLNDGGPLAPDFTPGFQDLTGVFIREVPQPTGLIDLAVTFQVADFPDEANVPELPRFFFEFMIGRSAAELAAGCEVALCVSLRAGFDRRGNPSGELASNCVTDDTNTTTCQPVPGAVIVATVDPVANTLTATIRGRDLRRGVLSPSVAVPGAVFVEADLFQGIAAYTGSSLLTSGATADVGDMCDVVYTLAGVNQPC